MSLAQLASKSGISKGHLSQIENNKVGSPTGNVLFSIAESLGASVDDLLASAASADNADVARLVRTHGWSPATARMLASINVDGLKPETEEDFEAVYNAIASALKDRRPSHRNRR